ncbi:AraC family transcriptional regulator [Paenibacillus radicis (ex Gao et al. 2016)]|nr:AraC family transcriptional regulator [Paenibacillus radicis (ex Gao et al. 2016)]
MSIIKQKRQRKFLRSMYLGIMLAMLLLLSLFAIVTYFSAGKAILNNEYQSNKKILTQVKFNIDYMDEMIRNLVLSLFYNPDVQTILYSNHSEMSETIKGINTVRTSIVNTNPFLHSIYLYNNYSKTYYTTGEELLFQDMNLDTMLRSKEVLPILKPVPRQIEYSTIGDKKRYENVVTYFMYDFKDDQNSPNGALVVNASANWILNNIRTINNTDLGSQDQIIILDGNGELIGDSVTENPLRSRVRETFLRQHNEAEVNAAQETTGFYTSDIEGKKYLITYAYVENMNWTLVKAQLYDEVFQNISKLKYTYFLITAGTLLLAFLISLYLSRRFYKPIDQLVSQFIKVDEENGRRNGKDEFSYLNEVFQHSIDKMNQYKHRSITSQEVMRAYLLRKLLVDSSSVSLEEFKQAQSDYHIWLDKGSAFLICIVKIDDYGQFKEKYSSRDQALYLYGIENISMECMSELSRCEVVEMKNEYIAFILHVNPNSDYKSMIMERWKQAQLTVMNYYHISFSVCISDPVESYTDLSEQHYETLNNSLYRLIYGNSCILTSEMIKTNAENPQLGYSATLEKKLVDALKSGSLPVAEETLTKIFREISNLNYNNALLSVMSLVNMLKTVVEEINRAKVEPIRVNFNLITKRLFALETLTELYESLVQLIRDMIAKMENVENDKQSILVETIKELVEANYTDPGLCLQFVASKLNLSPKSVSKLFNTKMNMSVADYINDVRLNKAIGWLEHSGLNMKEILVKIGVENESYFYKLFKKKYGATPKEYMLSESIKQILNNE